VNLLPKLGPVKQGNFIFLPTGRANPPGEPARASARADLHQTARPACNAERPPAALCAAFRAGSTAGRQGRLALPSFKFLYPKTTVCFIALLCLLETALSQVSNEAVKTNSSDAISTNCAAPPVFNAKENRERYEQAVKKARQWLDQLKVDPIELRAHGIKGKKKLAEILDTYFRLYSAANPQDKQNILTRVKSLTLVAVQTNYHDMLVINDLEFKQDATSYLRVAYLMERFGLDTKFYRAQIQKTHQRLNEHMASRGVDQRMAFHWYYEHFGLKEPFPLESAFQAGLIVSRKQVDWFKQNPMQSYDLTHEVFVPYKFGEDLGVDFFSPGDKTYLRGILADIIPWYIQHKEVDLLSEFILCAAYLKATDLPACRDGLNFLLESQNANGSWGQYEQYRLTMGNYVDQGLYLHTTMVALDALVMAFEFRKP